MDDFSINNFGNDPFGATDFTEMNKGVTPVFMRIPVKNDAKSEAEGRPIFDEMEVCRLFVAGDQFNQVSCPVDAHIKERFSEQYRKWKEKGEARTISGTPLREWPHLTVADVASFEALEIFSVEALANIPDTSLGRTMGLREFRERAKVWLLTSKDAAAASKIASDNVRLSEEVETLKTEMARMAAAFEKQTKKAA